MRKPCPIRGGEGAVTPKEKEMKDCDNWRCRMHWKKNSYQVWYENLNRRRHHFPF
jgi:hypothetical protein